MFMMPCMQSALIITNTDTLMRVHTAIAAGGGCGVTMRIRGEWRTQRCEWAGKQRWRDEGDKNERAGALSLKYN